LAGLAGHVRCTSFLRPLSGSIPLSDVREPLASLNPLLEYDCPLSLSPDISGT
jgi:hypothetical protein